MILDAFIIAISVLMTIIVCMLTLEKHLFTKLLFFAMLTNLGVLLVVALGLYQYNGSFLDVAIIYSILSFIVNQAILKHVNWISSKS